ncbi:uncharacterized protein TNCV_960941 [Trichonephila clavipes]|uniref:Uncharacterized protein n=1 Tax=Trichonephila clavipes TaxID=2585209 RepID=A0A8X6S5Z2_TRICX|nr:uncharacterized protein TNCV_960941 [Trichonephila clavipes]
MHDAIRSGIEAYKFCMISCDISFHICCTLASSSFKLVGCPTRRPKRSQICSIGDKPGDRAGQGSKGGIEALTTGSPHTNTIVTTADIESGFVAKDDLVPFRCSPVSSCVAPLTPNGGVDGWASRAAHVMGAAIPNVLKPGAFVWFKKRQGPLVKVLTVPGWRPMKQLAVHLHFLRCGGLLDDWSVKGVMNLVFVYMTYLGSTGHSTSPQHNQSDLIDELLA